MSDPFPANRPLNAGKFLRVMAVCWGLGLVIAVFAQFPWLVERVYAQGIGVWIARILAWMTAWYPYSIGEVLTLAVLVVLVGGFAAVCVQCTRKRRQWRNGFARYGLWLVTAAHVAVIAFYAVWGLNYARVDVFERQGWERLATGDAAPGAVDELADLAEELVSATNAAYVEAMGSEDAGEPSAPSLSLREIDEVLDRALDRMAAAQGMPPGFEGRRGPVKPWLGSWFFTKLGIMGMYFPFTGEAQINGMPPWSVLPHVIAHEKAHQRGITSEAEANFVGFLACMYSDTPYVQYSGLLFAQHQMLGTLGQNDLDRAVEIAEDLLPGVRRDYEAQRDFWARHRGPAQTAARALNDAYLRAQRVEGGIASYGMSVELMVLLAREQGGTLVPGGAE